MKKAINAWAFVNKTPVEAMTIAKEAGYDGIELNLEASGPTGLDSTPNDWAKIRAYSEEIGLPIHSVSTGLHWGSPLTSNDEDVREKAIAIVEKELEMAKALGADAILVVPGLVDDNVSYDVAYDRSLAAFMRLKEKAEALKIKIGIENVWNQFLLSPLEMRDFADKINSPYVGVYFDIGNILYTGLPEQWIRILGKRICKLHFKDYRRSGAFVDLLSGDVNWPAVMTALKDIGYDGWATAEMGPYTYNPEHIVWSTCAAMGQIL